MSSFGAGDLRSYMGGGGGNETPTQSSYSGNMQMIFLVLAAGVVMLFLVANIAGGTNKDNVGNGGYGGDGGTGSGIVSPTPTTSTIPGIDYDETDYSKYDLDEDYVAQTDLDDESIFGSLAEMQAWTACGDSDLVLKMLERHSFTDYEWYNDDDD